MNHSRIAIAAVAATLLAVPSIANTDTDLKINGSVKCYAPHDFKAERPINRSLLDRIDNKKPTNTSKINIEKFRLNLSSKTPGTKYGDITTNVELEGNSFDKEKGIKLHKAEINLKSEDLIFDSTIGLAESTFVDADASPEVLSPAALMGQPNFAESIFNLVRFNIPINQNVSFAVSTEMPNSEGSTNKFRHPTAVYALTYSDSWGHIGHRVLKQRWAAHGSLNKNKWNTGTQLSGAVKVGKDKLVGAISSGRGLGAYGIGFENCVLMDANQYKFNNSTSWLLGYTHHWNDKVRSNVAYSHTKIIKRDFNPTLKSAQDGAVNIIANVAKGVEFGMEYLIGSKKDVKDKDVKPDGSSNHLRSLSVTLTVKF